MGCASMGFNALLKLICLGWLSGCIRRRRIWCVKSLKLLVLCQWTKFEEAISKGFKDSEGAQHSFELKREVARNSEALKFTNSRLLQVERLQEAIYSVLRKGSEPGKLVSLEAAVEKIVP